MVYFNFAAINCFAASFLILNAVLVKGDEVNNSLRASVIKSLRSDAEDKSMIDPFTCITNNCPSGSYKQSCTGCSYDASAKKLTCTCEYNDYKSDTTTRISSYTGTCVNIENIDGYLECTDKPLCLSSSCRPGSYLQAGVCNACTESNPDTYDGTISCKCSQAGFVRATSYTGICSDLRNHNGYLKCFDKCPRGGCRDGDYIDSCQNCIESSADQKGEIGCECYYYNQLQWKSTFKGYCNNLKNVNGRLSCPSCPTGICPPGSYLDKCTNCSIHQFLGVLTCTCVKDDGSTAESTLARCPTDKSIVYENNQLQCV